MKNIRWITVSLLILLVCLTGCTHTSPGEDLSSDTFSVTAEDGTYESTTAQATAAEEQTKPETAPEYTPIAPLCVERTLVDEDAESASQGKYLYAILNVPRMTASDLSAVGDFLAKVVEAQVLIVDADCFPDAPALYTALCEDHRARGGEIVGVQIFGNIDLVPSFQIGYCVQMKDGVDQGDPFLTDLFFGNLNNDPQLLNVDYSVQTHFAEGLDVDLVPQWRVARLPLASGEFAAFMRKYDRFVADTDLKAPDLVSFSNPIFQSLRHVDDVGAFIERADKELGILKLPYRLYGNLAGDYPVQSPQVLGDMNPMNMAKENEQGIAEFIVNSHGDREYIIIYVYMNGKPYSEYFLHMDNVNQLLDANAYYLDCWSCLNGQGMKNNLTTTVLKGQCVGVFSTTGIISNNGVNRYADTEEMKRSNFFYFYYTYLKELSAGRTRSEAFFEAQQAYAIALMEDSEREVRWGSNYQFNIYNLLAYHNFGVLEPNYDMISEAKGSIPQVGH